MSNTFDKYILNLKIDIMPAKLSIDQAINELFSYRCFRRENKICVNFFKVQNLGRGCNKVQCSCDSLAIRKKHFVVGVGATNVIFQYCFWQYLLMY